jgi:hypothetical protein
LSRLAFFWIATIKGIKKYDLVIILQMPAVLTGPCIAVSK